MRKFIIEDDHLIAPFNEPARELSILNETLKLHHADVLDEVIGACPAELPLASIHDLPQVAPEGDEMVVYRDNLYFDLEFFAEFFEQARASRLPSRAVLPADDAAWMKYAVPLSRLEPVRDMNGRALYYPLDLWYFPFGYVEPQQWREIPIYSEFKEIGYYNVPDSMANVRSAGGDDETATTRDLDLTHLLTERSCLAIDAWVHVYYANVILGVFSRGKRFEKQITEHNLFALRVLFRAILEQKQVLSSSPVVQVGEGTVIDPSAVIIGPATIGRGCYIGPGVVIDNSIIGDHVNVAQGCQLMLSVVGNNSFLPFRAALFMSTLMEYTIVAQNTCLQMCVVGRNSFVGAGNTFTDFNLLPKQITALDGHGGLSDTGQPVLGGCVGHNVRIGSGMVVMPARVIESDVVLFASPDRRVVARNITYEESDHHKVRAAIAKRHKRRYPRELGSEEAYLEPWE
jgi:UDP-N-acetylglucosamine diphosphorylase / glucose-1-phosphate thymidylyltransferase / UDP-N-acetylgalactosamine diphosphorylase / glucosamine-1-phosphate N-acetyltransferase / galactosamine-1-phosphate N-acetyltransferase